MDFGLGLGLGRLWSKRADLGEKKGFWPDVFIGESG